MLYSQYLQTDHWLNFRISILSERPVCEHCGAKSVLNIHHETYERLGREEPTDVLVLCRDCHCKIHGIPTDNHRRSFEKWNPTGGSVNDRRWHKMHCYKCFDRFVNAEIVTAFQKSRFICEECSENLSLFQRPTFIVLRTEHKGHLPSFKFFKIDNLTLENFKNTDESRQQFLTAKREEKHSWKEKHNQARKLKREELKRLQPVKLPDGSIVPVALTPVWDRALKIPSYRKYVEKFAPEILKANGYNLITAPQGP